MKNVVLQKSRLKEFLRSLDKTRLIAPVNRGGKTRFEVIEDINKAHLDLDDYTASPKGALFPQNGTLFSFCSRDGKLDIAPVQDAPQTVVFGIRPCDAKSFVILDPLFTGQVEDPYYRRRRDATLLIGHACKAPTNRCFCPSLGGSPGGTEGLDVLLTDIGDDYFVEIVSDRGRALLKCAAALFGEVAESHASKKEKAGRKSLDSIRRAVDLKLMHEKLPKVFQSSIWQTMGNKCIGCGICTYNCPTCHCFDIQDEGRPNQGRRVRVWDACMYPEFTLHASGENPRKDRSARIRNRIMHKFTYYPLAMGHIGCVGCGRCIELCPVNEDIIEILNTVRAAHD